MKIKVFGKEHELKNGYYIIVANESYIYCPNVTYYYYSNRYWHEKTLKIPKKTFNKLNNNGNLIVSPKKFKYSDETYIFKEGN